MLGNCLQFDPIKRTKDAQVILSQIEAALRQQPLEIPRVQWFSNDLMVTAQSQKQDKQGKQQNQSTKVEPGKELKPLTSSKDSSLPKFQMKISAGVLKIILGVFVFAAVAAFVGLVVTGQVVDFSAKNIPDQFAKISNVIGEEKLNTTLNKFLDEDQSA